MRARGGLALAASIIGLAACDSALPEPKVELSDAMIIAGPQAGSPAALHFTLRTNNDPTRLVGIKSSSGESVGFFSQGRPIDPHDLVFDPARPLVFGSDPSAIIGTFHAPGSGIVDLEFDLEPMGSFRAAIKIVSQRDDR